MKSRHSNALHPSYSTKSGVELQPVVVPHRATGRNNAKFNSVEVNLPFGKMKEESGKLTFIDDCVAYESATYGAWRLEASAIRFIGEFTNQSGPALDDHFLVFIKRGEDAWYEASFYSAGREEAMQAFARRFPGMSGTGLANSADFKSRVLWPPEHMGKPLFDFRAVKRGSRWHDRLLDQLFPPSAIESDLKPEFKERPTSRQRTTRGM